MSLEKQVVIDRIEVVEKGIVQVRQATRILEGGNELAKSYHRWIIEPGQDYSQHDAKVQAVCAAVHTPEVIAAYQAQFNQGA